MSFGALLFLAVGLGMDGAAASAARAMVATHIRWRDAALVALLFGGFHTAFPMLGWLVGEQVGALATTWDHWIAFAVLGGIGAKMLYEALRRDPAAARTARPPEELFSVRLLFLLAFATSIDAFVAGIALPLLDAPFLASVLTIGVATGALSAAALWAGRMFGTVAGARFEALGGLLIIALGVKILVEHLTAG